MLNIGIIGNYHFGKSTLINCIMGYPLATTGNGTATTHTTIHYLYGDNYIEYYDRNRLKNVMSVSIDNLTSLNGIDTAQDIEEVFVYLCFPLLKFFRITDLPGLSNNQHDNAVTMKALKQIDYAIVVETNERTIGGEMSQLYDHIQMLKKFEVPYYLILNCRENHWDPTLEYNYDIANANHTILRSYPPITYPFKVGEYIIVNLMWYWLAIQGLNDENQRNRYEGNLKKYQLWEKPKEELIEASNFNLIQKIFSMENVMYLELRKDLKEEIMKLKKELCPIGTIQMFAFQDMSDNEWLFCDGSQYSIDEYSALYKTIRHTFDKENTPEGFFCVPDLQGKFIRGWDMSGAVDKMREFGSYQEDSFQDHGHKGRCDSEGSHQHRVGTDQWNRRYGGFGSDALTHKDIVDFSSTTKDYYTNDTGSHIHAIFVEQSKSLDEQAIRVSTETRPKNIALLYCIKAK